MKLINTFLATIGLTLVGGLAFATPRTGPVIGPLHIKVAKITSVTSSKNVYQFGEHISFTVSGEQGRTCGAIGPTEVRGPNAGAMPGLNIGGFDFDGSTISYGNITSLKEGTYTLRIVGQAFPAHSGKPAEPACDGTATYTFTIVNPTTAPKVNTL